MQDTMYRCIEDHRHLTTLCMFYTFYEIVRFWSNVARGTLWDNTVSKDATTAHRTADDEDEDEVEVQDEDEVEVQDEDEDEDFGER